MLSLVFLRNPRGVSEIPHIRVSLDLVEPSVQPGTTKTYRHFNAILRIPYKHNLKISILTQY